MAEHESVEAQRRRFDGEAESYEAHHNDAWSQAYRSAAIRDRLLDFDLQDKKVLDAMCASGIETGYLLERGAIVTGLDVSERNVSIYRRRWSCECRLASIHDTGFEGASFDVVHVFGGLHHVLPILPEVMSEIHRILKVGGVFTFVEPNRDTALNRFRDIWYARDPRFTDEEASISYRRQLEPFLGLGFRPAIVMTGGNFGYLVASQSHILGIPRWLKRALWRPAMAVERFASVLPFMPRLWLAGAWVKT